MIEPSRPARQGDIFAWAEKVWGYIRAIRPKAGPGIEMTETSSGTIISLKKTRRQKPKFLPFDVVLLKTGTAEAPEWKVRVHPGKVNERVPGEEEKAIVDHEPANLYEDAEADPPKLSEHAVSANKGVYITVSVKADGNVGTDEPGKKPVNIAIEPLDPAPESIHYRPKVDNETPNGAPGFYYYKLAEVLATEGGGMRLENFFTGSHISHFQELPKVKSTAAAGEGIGVIPKKWDNDAREYRLRALSVGVGNLNITTQGDLVEVRGNKIGNEIIIYEGHTPLSETLEFSDGLLDSGQEIEGGEDPPVEIEEPFEILIPQVKGKDDLPQVTVTLNPGVAPGVKGNVYEVSGNGKAGKITVTTDGGSPVTAAEWKDGLVITDGTTDIPVDTGDGLPGGSEGNLLVHNGTNWVAFGNPAAPSGSNKNFLIHDGTNPSWLVLEAREIQICESGSPVTKTIYVEP